MLCTTSDQTCSARWRHRRNYSRNAVTVVLNTVIKFHLIFSFLSLAKGTSFKVGVIEAGAYHPDEPKINIPGTGVVLASRLVCS